MSDLDEAASDALNDFAGGALVFLLEGEINAESALAPNGSGTVLRTPGGHVVVLSARHVFEDDPPAQFALGGRAVQHGVPDAIGEQFWHPSVDVAVARLKPTAAALFAHAALPCDLVAGTNEEDPEGDTAMICGFLARYRRTAVDHSNRRVDHDFASVTYSTDVNGKDERGRYRVAWGEGELSGTIPASASDAARQLGIKVGQLFDLAHPGGISGGPLWRFRKEWRKSEVWEPSKAGRLIGIASSYLPPPDSIEFCPSVATWGDWFRDTIAKIDAGPASAGGSNV
ncbi:MAG TPA: hypothetical protein VHP33_06255 [Polyangiaceae bacterium]|nr:hypothetical protein [Polyangiaceae bacterium]